MSIAAIDRSVFYYGSDLVPRLAKITAITAEASPELAGAPAETVSLFVMSPESTFCLPRVEYSDTPAVNCWTTIP